MPEIEKFLVMNYMEQIEQIKSLFKSNGFGLLGKEISEQQMIGGTAGERFMMVCSRLLGIKNNMPAAYEFVKTETDQLIAYANSIGLYPKPTNPSNI